MTHHCWNWVFFSPDSFVVTFLIASTDISSTSGRFFFWNCTRGSWSQLGIRVCSLGCRQMRGQETDLRVRMIGHRASRASSCAKFRTSLSLPIGTAVLAVEKCQKVSTKDKSAFTGTSMSLNSSNKNSRTWTYAHFRIVTSGTSIYFDFVGTRNSLTPPAGFRYNIYRRELVSIFRTYTTV